MSKLQSIIGVLKMFVHLTKEEWDEMDHKLFRIAAGALGFIITSLVWYYFFRPGHF